MGSFATHGDNQGRRGGHGLVTAADGIWAWPITYHRPIHYASDCTIKYKEIVQVQIAASEPSSTNTNGDELEEVQFGMVGGVAMSLLQHTKQAVHNTCVLLDNASTINAFVNPQLVSNIQPGPHRLHILCAAGAVYTDQIPDLKGYGTVWFLPNGFANILSLRKLKQKYQVTYDSSTS